MCDTKIIGSWGESVAVQFLEKNKYEILTRNFKCRQGEIDIIAKNKEYLIFVEVKTRSNIFYGIPSQAVNEKKKKNIYKATKYFLHVNKLEEHYIRFDVIEVYIVKDKFEINHIKQVW